MPTRNLWGISNQPRNIRAGWTASSIGHNEALHKSAQGVLAPSAQQSQLMGTLTNRILGVNNIKMGTSIPAGVPVGTAQNVGNIPSIVQSAIGNLNSNIDTYNTQDLLKKFMEAVGVSRQPVVVNTVSPAVDEYYKNKNTIMAEPAKIQTDIDQLRWETNRTQPTGIMSITPGIPGGYEGSAQQKLDRQRTQAYIAQKQARKAAQTTGWLPYMPSY